MNNFGIGCALFLATLSTAACGVSSDNGSFGDGGVGNGNGNGDGGRRGPSEFADAAPPEVCSKMDILFVIDDSGSMSEEQDNLRQNFPQFINVLDNYMAGTGLLDYRLGVTTTGRDVDYSIAVPGPFPPFNLSERGDNGVLRQDCGMTHRWIDRTDNSVSDTFSCVADVGTSGPGLEMPLYTTQLALGARMDDGTNTGFLRPDSLLAIIYLTDEDDCSRTDNNFTITTDACGLNNPDYLPVSDTVDFLDTLTGDRGRWATAVIAGATSCNSSFGSAIRAKNLQKFVDLTGANAVFSSICDGDLAAPLAEAIATFDAACRGFPPID